MVSPEPLHKGNAIIGCLNPFTALSGPTSSTRHKLLFDPATALVLPRERHVSVTLVAEMFVRLWWRFNVGIMRLPRARGDRKSGVVVWFDGDFLGNGRRDEEN